MLVGAGIGKGRPYRPSREAVSQELKAKGFPGEGQELRHSDKDGRDVEAESTGSRTRMPCPSSSIQAVRG